MTKDSKTQSKQAAQNVPWEETKAEPAKTTAVVTWKERMEAVRAQAAETEAPKGAFLSFKGGVISYNDEIIPNNKIEVVIVDFMLENAIYKEKYNPAKSASPMCYAFGRTEDAMAPHENCDEPQHDNCTECPNNEWGTDPEGGRGKACRNSRRIAVLPLDVVMKGPEAIKKAQVVMCKLPVTSIKEFSTYINQVVKVMERAPFEVAVELSVKPHPTSLFRVGWRALNTVEDPEILEALYAKRESIQKLLVQAYPKFEEEAPAKQRSSKY